MDKRSELDAHVVELDAIHKCTRAPRVWRKQQAVRAQLKHLDLDRVEYALLPLKHNYYLGSNKCCKLLAHKLRVKVTMVRVQLIKNRDREHITGDSPIANTFYREL